MTRTFRLRALRAPAFVFAVAVMVSACDIFSLGARNRPEEMRIVVTAEGLEDFELEGPVPLVTSRNFFFAVSEEGDEGEMILVTADTVMVNLPVDQTFDMAPNYNLLVRMLPPEDLPPETTPEEAPTYFLQAWVDGRESFAASRPMFPGSWIEFFVRHSL